jgi:Domain of unknown function (DUF3472)/Domain of unknown function (DUF5077)
MENILRGYIFFGICAALLFLPGASTRHRSITIPLGGNAWRITSAGAVIGDSAGGYIDNNGVGGWTDSTVSFDIWLRTAAPGTLRIWVVGALRKGKSRISIEVGGHVAPLELEGRGLHSYEAGSFVVSDTGYQRIRLRAVSRTGPEFASVPAIVVQGTAIDGRTSFVPNDKGNFFHWGRRGPSVHLNYPLPPGFGASWFYNEVTVPPGQDVQGSYFMACGIAQGYFGMQVNSPTERHILFSVWSPFETDDPASIPDSQRIVLLQKGPQVHTGEFGHEGSGGQSYLDYPWRAGRTYAFLLHAERGRDRHTIFTAWWRAPEEGDWRLIASFSRPETAAGLSRLHSFLENFEPEEGNRAREVVFNHAWAADSTGHWVSLNKATFTIDNTGRKGYRLDYAGGVRDGSFYLKNGGFFNDWTPAGTLLERAADGGDRGPAVALPGVK